MTDDFFMIRRRCVFLAACTLCVGQYYFSASNTSSTIARAATVSLRNKPSQRLDWPFEPSSDAVMIYFIHVGKAGGTSLNKRLELDDARRILSCRKQAMAASRKHSEAIESPNVADAHYYYCLGEKGIDYLPKSHANHSLFRTSVYGVLHIANVKYSDKDRLWLRQNTNLLVFPVRDPVDRLLSAFRFHHALLFDEAKSPKRNSTTMRKYREKAKATVVYIDCFPEFEDVGLALTVAHANNYTSECRQIAKNLVQGGPRLRRNGYAHFRFNYQYYTKDTWPAVKGNEPSNTARKAVAVIRTDSQWSDVERLESLMGGDPATFHNCTLKFSHGSEKNLLRSSITQEATIGVCCAIRDDIQVYHNLVVASVNLYPVEKEETLRHTMVHCGVAGASNDDGLAQYSALDVLNFQWINWTHPSCNHNIPARSF